VFEVFADIDADVVSILSKNTNTQINGKSHCYKIWHMATVMRNGTRSFPGWILSPDGFYPERRFPESRFPDCHFPG